MVSFLLIGQSNMAGRGFLQEAHEIDGEHIYTLRMGRWQPMFRPINPDRRTSGVSLGERFAERFVQTNGVDVGLVCCADGGTRLSQWMPGEVLYEHAVFQAKLAARSTDLIGVLWHQGESDCSEACAPTYQARLATMFESLRADLGKSDLPILVGGLGDFLLNYADEQIRTYTPTVNRALQAYADVDPYAAFVSAEGLGCNPDGIHFSADALYTFGERYYEAFAALNPTCRLETRAADLTRTALEAL